MSSLLGFLFLSPLAALATAAAAVSIPIAIHLLSRRRYRVGPWGTARSSAGSAACSRRWTAASAACSATISSACAPSGAAGCIPNQSPDVEKPRLRHPGLSLVRRGAGWASPKGNGSAAQPYLRCCRLWRSPYTRRVIAVLVVAKLPVAVRQVRKMPGLNHLQLPESDHQEYHKNHRQVGNQRKPALGDFLVVNIPRWQGNSCSRAGSCSAQVRLHASNAQSIRSVNYAITRGAAPASCACPFGQLAIRMGFVFASHTPLPCSRR